MQGSDVQRTKSHRGGMLLRNRRHSESVMRSNANERGSNKFNFLLPSDPYQAYYRTKIDEFRGVGVASPEGAAAAAGPSTSASKPQAPAIVVKQDDQVKKSVVVEQVLELDIHGGL